MANDVLRTLIAEAYGEGPEGMRRVAETIINRAAIRGLSLEEVVREANQYTGLTQPGANVKKLWDDPKAIAAAQAAFDLALEPGDPTGGADHYHTKDVNPRWNRSMPKTGEHGSHVYYASRPIPPGEIPQVATALDVTPPKDAPKPAARPDRTLIGGRDDYLQEQEVRLAPYRYEYAPGTKRNLPVSDALADQLTKSVTAVYGPDYTVGVMSGAQGRGSAGQVGSRRHGTEVAADVWVYDPTGRRLTGNELVPLSQHWLASGVGSVGFPADGRALHLDLIGGNVKGSVPLGKGEGRLWYYGNPSQSLSSMLSASLSGKVRPNYAFDPEIVEKGLIPPAEVPSAVASALDVTEPRVPPVPAPAIDREPRTAPVPEMRQGLLDMLKDGPPMPDASQFAAMEAARALASGPGTIAPSDAPGLLSFLAGEAPASAQAAPIVPRPPAWALEAPAVAMARNSIPAADLLASTRNDQITPWMQKDLGGITDVADFLFGKEMTTSLDPSAPAPMPVAAAPAAQPSPAPAAPAPAQQLSPSQLATIYQQGGPTRPPVNVQGAPTATPAQMLIAGSGAPWSAADGPATRPRPQPAPTPAPSGLGSTSPQQGLGNVANAGGQLIESATPGFYRIAGLDGGAGSVAMPRDVRPQVTIPEHVPSARRGDMNAPLLMPTYDAFQEAFGIQPKADYPNPIRSVVDMEATQRKPTPSQPMSPSQVTTFAEQERGPTFKTVMREERIENPEYKVWKANELSKAQSIPLGDRAFNVSRDSKAAVLAGENFAANNMPQQWITRQVPTRVPVTTSAPAQTRPTVAPVAVPAVVPVAGTQPVPRGLFDMLAPTGGPLASILGLGQSSPIDLAEAERKAISGHLNAPSFIAMTDGRSSYTNSDGAVLPTTSMSGKIRNTYGD